MSTTRRSFVTKVTAGATGVLALPGFVPADLRAFAASQGSSWDTSWTTKLTGRHKACFDCTEPESGYGVWRASAWVGQYGDVFKTAPADMSPVIVLRHNAIILAMQQAFWDRYGIGKMKGITHPLTEQPTDRNPALLDEKDGIPAPFNQAGLHKQLARGVVALACNLALQDLVALIAKADHIDDAAAGKKAVGYLVPGVVLQPSGVFAAIRAQEAGCSYLKAS